MNPFDDAIGLENLEKPALSRINNRTVITGTQDNPGVPPQFRQYLFEEPVFTDISQFHCLINSGNARAVSVSALKRACMVIGTRIEPLHS